MAFKHNTADHKSADNIEWAAAATIERDIRFGCVYPRDTSGIGGKDDAGAGGKAENFKSGRVLINIVDRAVAGIKSPAGKDSNVRVMGHVQRQIITVFKGQSIGHQENAIGSTDKNTRLVSVVA